MKKFNRFSKIVLATFIYTAASLQSAVGDDTEIFFAPADDVDGIYPNIMFIIDSSGSMGWGVDGTTDSRMEVVQDVMDEVLTDITNVNAGLMRFNNGRPGPVIFPVLDIDKEATPTAFQTITNGSNDGSESTATVVDLTSGSLQFNGTNEYVAVRFEDLNVPQGATILSASVVFTADRDASGAANIKIGAEKVDDAPPFTDGLADISLRAVNRTSTIVGWNIEDWTSGNTYATEDISKVIEEVTDQVGWCGGNDMVLFFKNQSGATRNAYSKEGIDANPPADADDPFTIFAPRIRVEYSQTFDASASKCMSNEAVSQISSQAHDFEVESDGNVNNLNSPDLALYYEGSDPQIGVGLVFQNIKVPKDATIKYAYIDFVAKNTTSGAVTTEFNVVNSGNVTNPDTMYLSGEPSGLIAGPTWNTGDDWVANQGYRSPDLSTLISAIVSRSDWSLDNNMAFFLKGSAGYHETHSYSSPGKAPKLRIGFEGQWEPGVNTIRDDLKAAVAGLVPSGGTPISGTMAEAGSYFKGDPVFYGASRNGNRFSRVSHELSYDASGTVIRNASCSDDNLDSSNCASEVIGGSPNYVSPIVESCQTNHIVYLTDGASNSHRGSTNTIYSNWSNGGTCSSNNGGNDCSVKMAAWLHTNDVAPGIPGEQTVTTNMIGFGPGADPVLMRDMAVAGGGGYYSPTDRQTLIDDITSIINDITNVNTTFVTSGVTVNQYNRLTHNDQLYFSLFTPQAGVTWPGNIKRYRLSGGDIVDATNASAINPLNSEFKDEASSFWSSVVDGNDVTRGGTAEQFGTNRNLYTDIAGDNITLPGNKVQDSNVSITAALLGGVTPLRRTTILDWAEGYDVSDPAYDPADSSSLTLTPARKDLGDPLHSQPTVLQYNSPSVTTRIYVGTNHGYLHSFNADDGEEEWAYIPQELLSQLDTVVENPNGSKVYGLDGSAAIYLVDGNNNGAVDAGDRALLYIGQRRGGRNYYAVDITDPDSPQLLFKIEGGIENDDFEKLGQTWSTPTIAKMNLAGVNSDKLVMIFGGGYDEGQDAESIATRTDTVGNTVFIVDAYDGSLLWSSKDDTEAHGGLAGPIASMNSVPSQVTAFDLNEDELIDHMYVTDTKAQVFRFDVDNDLGKIKGGRIAHLNGLLLSENRRMYYSPDVALIRQVGDSFISIAIGSGFRAHPLNTEVTDHFFVLKDKGALSGSFDMDASLLDLQDVTSLADIDNDGVSDAVELLNDTVSPKKGWYINFDAVGEKVIERSVTFNNAVIFTSYIPPGSTGDVCQAAAGGGRVYALNVLNGNPYVDTNTDGTLNESDRYAELPGGGIAPPPQVLLEGDGDASSGGVTPRLCIGTKCDFDILPPLSDGLMGIKWRREE